MTLIAPSILASDWGKLNEEISAVEKAGADWLHLDVMDGQFVPPITFGPDLVKAAKRASKLPLDVHLMIVEPEKQIKAFAQAGANIITVHQEVCPHLHRVIQSIKEEGAKAGVAINPSTPVESLIPILNEVDLILIMSVNPGWGGQSFIPSAENKIRLAYDLIAKSGRKIDLEVDGGITDQTAHLAKSAGANVLVAGTYIFKSKNYKEAVTSLR